MSKQNRGPQFTRQIPKFLKQYSQLLTVNKKNYMNEELGGYDEDEEGLDIPVVEISEPSIHHSASVKSSSDTKVEVEVEDKPAEASEVLVRAAEEEEDVPDLENNDKIQFRKRKKIIPSDKDDATKKSRVEVTGRNNRLLSFEADDDDES